MHFSSQLKIKTNKAKPLNRLINHKFTSLICMSPLKLQCYVSKYIQMSKRNIKHHISKVKPFISHTQICLFRYFFHLHKCQLHTLSCSSPKTFWSSWLQLFSYIPYPLYQQFLLGPPSMYIQDPRTILYLQRDTPFFQATIISDQFIITAS